MTPLFIREVLIDWESVDQGSYLRNIRAIASADSVAFHSHITFLTGENGSGKSTLLEAIAVKAGFNPEGGTKNYSFSTYDSHSELHDAMRLIRSPYKPEWGFFLRAESFYNVATAEEEYTREKGRPMHYHEKSHGESFLAAAQANFRANGIYFLDEPEAALSPQRQLTMMIEIHDSVLMRSQFIIATNSPILLGMPDAEILSFDDGSLRPVAYEETGSYRITKMFVNSREQILKNLFDD